MVCWRTRRSASWFSAGVQSSSQNRVVRFEVFAEPGGLDGGHPVVAVVQQRDVGTELVPHGLEHPGEVVEVGAGVPVLLHRLRAAAGGFVVVPGFAAPGVGRLRRDPVDRLQRGHPGLHADGPVSLLLVGADRVEQLRQFLARRMPVRHQPVPRRSPEQLVDGEAGDLALDVPQRHVDRGDRRHRHRAPPPIGAAVQELPGVLDARLVGPDQQRHHVLGQVRDDGELAAVQRRIAQPRHAVGGRDLQRHEVAVGTRDDHVGPVDGHRFPPAVERASADSVAGSPAIRTSRGVIARSPGAPVEQQHVCTGADRPVRPSPRTAAGAEVASRSAADSEPVRRGDGGDTDVEGLHRSREEPGRHVPQRSVVGEVHATADGRDAVLPAGPWAWRRRRSRGRCRGRAWRRSWWRAWASGRWWTVGDDTGGEPALGELRPQVVRMPGSTACAPLPRCVESVAPASTTAAISASVAWVCPTATRTPCATRKRVASTDPGWCGDRVTTRSRPGAASSQVCSSAMAGGGCARADARPRGAVLLRQAGTLDVDAGDRARGRGSRCARPRRSHGCGRASRRARR